MFTFLSLFACLGCTLKSPGFLVACLVMGAPVVVFFVMQPFGLNRLRRVWGLPQFDVSDLLSLSFLLVWPALLARGYVHDHGHRWIILWFCAFAACTSFLWLRGLWILQQRSVTSFVKRTLFLSALLPLAIFAGFVVGYGVLLLVILLITLALISVDGVAFVVGLSLVTWLLVGVLRVGLIFVFGSEQDIQEPLREVR